jgi:thiamine kinase-like enzyme
MKNKIKSCSFALLFLLCSCGAPRIDEKHAASVLKDKLSIPGNVSAQKLKGGLSSAMLFIATDGLKKYVVRFIKHRHQKSREKEIYNLKIASNEGYGPQIYFADPSRGIVIMEYLAGKTISYQDLQSDQLYVALAHLLQKIHQGQAFKDSGYNVFKRINKGIQINKPNYSDYVPLTKVEHVVTVIHQALLPHLTTTPCHKDLHGGNLIFLGNEFKAIDYGNAGPGEPYFDVATIATYFCSEPAHEKVFFAMYLGRQPSAAEGAKLYLMKQVVLIKWALGALRRLSPESLHQYKSIKAPSIKDLLMENLKNTLDLSKPENNLKLLKALFKKVFDNFESQEFHSAVNVLSKKDI